MKNSFAIRPLTLADAAFYRALRQHILHRGGGRFFSDSYVREKTFSCPADWQQWCTETKEHCIIGTFYGTSLIGIMGIIAYGDPEDKTVEWELTWLEPEYRGTGLAQAAYEIEHAWSVSNGYKKAVVFIRHDNQRSIDIRKKQGFQFVEAKNEQWADGSAAPALCFTMDLADCQTQRERALASLKQTLELLDDTSAASFTKNTNQVSHHIKAG